MALARNPRGRANAAVARRDPADGAHLPKVDLITLVAMQAEVHEFAQGQPRMGLIVALRRNPRPPIPAAAPARYPGQALAKGLSCHVFSRSP